MKHVYKCDSCRKMFDKESDCLEHEKKCMSIEGAEAYLNKYFVHENAEDTYRSIQFIYPITIDKDNCMLVCLEYRFFTNYFDLELTVSTERVRMVEIIENYDESDEQEFKEWMDKLSPYADMQITVKGAKE